MRTPLLAANWKMYKTGEEAVAYLSTLAPLVTASTGSDVVVAPPFTALRAMAERARETLIALAGQDLFWEPEGAFTGAISGGMLREAGATYVIVGHSERRRVFGDDDRAVARKVQAALATPLTPIVCIGESLEEREQGQTLEVLDRQLAGGLEGLTSAIVAGLVLAYEPVWAIGTGRTATPDQAQAAHAHVRQRLAEWWGSEAAESCRVLYGGSVKPGNAKDLLAQPDIDGALVGGASLDPEAFFAIVTAGSAG